MSITVNYDNDVKAIKNKVLTKVAYYKWLGELENKKDSIPYEIIDGLSPKFRCCVYKEREIIRQRVKLAMGKNVQDNEKCSSIINVLPAACEGCPINRFQVTENCQKCIAKKCVNACPFGAITVTGKGAYIDQEKCKECGRCAAICPYNAIADLVRPCKRSCPVDAFSMDNSSIAEINGDKCIKCGKCIAGCPFGAIVDTSSICDIIDEIMSGNKIAAIIAPAIEGQFGEHVNLSMIKNAILELGFSKVTEVAQGADAVSVNEAKELIYNSQNNIKMTTSCCSAFVNLIYNFYPKLIDNISKSVSPMVVTARYLKKKDKSIKTVFIGPCIAKKDEANKYSDAIDYVITFEELLAMFNAKNIEFKPCEDTESDASIYARNYALAGGVFDALMQAVSEMESDSDLDISCKKCSGIDECKKALSLMGAGKISEDIIEGMICEMGCISGPSGLASPQKVKINRLRNNASVKKRKITEYTDSSGILGKY